MDRIILDKITILICTDAHEPQVNGVVNTYKNMVRENEKAPDGVELKFLTPNDFYTLPNPFYKEIRLSLPLNIAKKIKSIRPSYIHIATEGPIGWAVRNYCNKNRIPYTTSYHTKFPEFLNKTFMIPTKITEYFMKKFHENSRSVMVATNSLRKELSDKGFRNLRIWSRGVDTEIFSSHKPYFDKKILTYVGRISEEKNLKAFLDIETPGCQKWIIGDGPLLRQYMLKYSNYPEVVFIGKLKQNDIAYYLSQSSVFVFPSRSDTFGLVIIEALCAGVPVAAFNVTGPKDIIGNDTKLGFLVNKDEDLHIAIKECLYKKKVNYEYIKNFGRKYTWKRSYNQFLENIIG